MTVSGASSVRRGSGDRTFVDTNVLVYALDGSEPDKREMALERLDECSRQGALVISTQVLVEFYAVVTRKLQPALSREEGEREVQRLARWHVVTTDTKLVLRALALSRERQLSHWDALILQAAVDSGCTTLLTEDLHDGLEAAGVRVRDPFGEWAEI